MFTILIFLLDLIELDVNKMKTCKWQFYCALFFHVKTKEKNYKHNISHVGPSGDRECGTRVNGSCVKNDGKVVILTGSKEKVFLINMQILQYAWKKKLSNNAKISPIEMQKIRFGTAKVSFTAYDIIRTIGNLWIYGSYIVSLIVVSAWNREMTRREKRTEFKQNSRSQ